MQVFTRYLTRSLGIHTIMVLAALSALSLSFELTEQADNVLAASNNQFSAVLKFAALRLPDIVAQMLPFSVLLAALVTLTLLMRHSELVAVWSCGVSSFGVMLAFMPLAVLLGLVQLALDDLAVPATLGKLQAWGVADFRRGGSLAGDGEAVWLLSGNDIVRLPLATARAGEVTDLTIFRRRADGVLIEQIEAAHADRLPTGWRLRDVVRHDVATASSQILPELAWDGSIDVEHLPLISATRRELSLADLALLIEREGFGQRPLSLSRTWLQYRIAAAVNAPLLIFLVVASVQTFRRNTAISRLLLLTVGIGFAFFAFDNLSLALGETGFLPPWFAAWGPKAALSCLIASMILRNEY